MRKGRNRGAATGDAVECRMCGRAVAVGRDGRCPLGHFVGHPQPEAAAVPAPFPGPDAGDGLPEPAAVPVPAIGDARAATAEPEPAPPAAAAAPQPAAWPAAEAATGPTPAPGDADLTSDLFADFGDLGGFGDPAGSDDPAGLDLGDLDGFGSLEGTSGHDAAGDLDDLGSGDGGLSDPADAVETLDLLNWGAAASALDAQLPVPAADAAGDGPAVPAEEPATEVAPEVEDEAVLDAEDRRVARRRAIGIVGGTIAAFATVVGSILALPL